MILEDINKDPIILLKRWSGRIMSEPLGKIFFHQNTLFLEKKMSVQNKNLKFLFLVFWKFNLSKLTLLFFKFSMLYVLVIT